MTASAKSSLPEVSPATITTLLTALSLPPPLTVEPLQVTAAFHSIYLVHFGASVGVKDVVLHPTATPAHNVDGSLTLVLRVSGADIPHAKTANEVAVLHWLAHNTNIPVPVVVRHDATTDNALGREFTLLERIPGRSVDKMYDSLTEAAKVRLVRQLTDILLELNKHEWHHVGGLQLEQDTGDVIPGPVLEDTFWMVPDIEKYWAGTAESVTSLNPMGPFKSHADLVRALLAVYVHAISVHESLAWLRSDVAPRLAALLADNEHLPEAQLCATRLILAHKDLHFANVMATDDGIVTGILDWEFAGVVPALRWDPVRAFLWNGKQGDESGVEKERLRSVFEGILKERGVDNWWTAQDASEEVANVWTVLRFTRALVEVCPRGQGAELVEGWRDAVLAALTKLGV